jgi:hypothetical protein
VFGHYEHHKPQEYSLLQLLPARFGPQDLLEDTAAPLLLQPQQHHIEWTAPAQQVLQQRQGESGFQQAAEEAFTAAKKVGAGMAAGGMEQVLSQQLEACAV